MNNGVTLDINRDIDLSQQKEEEIILCLNQIIMLQSFWQKFVCYRKEKKSNMHEFRTF